VSHSTTKLTIFGYFIGKWCYVFRPIFKVSKCRNWYCSLQNVGITNSPNLTLSKLTSNLRKASIFSVPT
jgi:hypothetical protein